MSGTSTPSRDRAQGRHGLIIVGFGTLIVVASASWLCQVAPLEAGGGPHLFCGTLAAAGAALIGIGLAVDSEPGDHRVPHAPRRAGPSRNFRHARPDRPHGIATLTHRPSRHFPLD